MPHEFSIGDVYFSPLLFVILIAITFTWITIVIFNRTRISRFIAYPSLTFVALSLIYAVVIDHLFLQF